MLFWPPPLFINYIPAYNVCVNIHFGFLGLEQNCLGLFFKLLKFYQVKIVVLKVNLLFYRLFLIFLNQLRSKK